MLTAPIIRVEVLDFIEPLTTFAHGVKLLLKYNDVSFTCNYVYPPFLYTGKEPNLAQLVAEHDGKYRSIFKPGSTLEVEAYLHETASDHRVGRLRTDPAKDIKELALLDWEIKGKVLSEVNDEEVLVDCGIPLVSFCNSTMIKPGDFISAIGELRLFPVKNPL
jgi:hypothetical protein